MFPIIPRPNGPVAGAFAGPPRTIPTPPASLPALPLPPWTEGWAAGGPWTAPPAEVYGPGPGLSFAGPAPPVSLPNSALDYQTTVSFNPLPPGGGGPSYPALADSVFVAPHASVVGAVTAEAEVFIGFGTTVRADGGGSIHIGPRCHLHDRVSLGGMPGPASGSGPGPAPVTVGAPWAIELGEGVSCLPGSVITGSTRVGRNVQIGAGAILQNADVGDDCLIHPGSVVMGVRIPAGRMVDPGLAIWRQEQADRLPAASGEFRETNASLVSSGAILARAYREQFPVTPWQQQ